MSDSHEKLNPLTVEEQARTLAVLRLGGDRETAAHAIGHDLSTLRGALVESPEFAREVRRAEAAAELTHMQNVYHAAKQNSQWRPSPWWLERHDPDRFSNRKPRLATRKQLELLSARLAKLVAEHITDPSARERIQQEMLQQAEVISVDETNQSERIGLLRIPAGRVESTDGGVDCPARPPGSPNVPPPFFCCHLQGDGLI